MRLDPALLAASLRRLRDRGESSGDLTEALRAVTTACVDLFDITGSGIMLADEQNVNRYVVASDTAGRALEVAEAEVGQGPCTEAFVTGAPVASSDLRSEPRWSALALRLQGSPVRAVMGVPVRIGTVPVGTLDVYRDVPGDWDDSESSALARYADVVGGTLSAALSAHRAEELASQLQYALDYRVVIERGVGYLMARDDVDPVTAFNLLRRTARDAQVKIGVVAARLLDTGRLTGSADAGAGPS